MKRLSTKLIKSVDGIVASSPESMVAVFEYSGVYRYASPSHHELLGYQPDELLGRGLSEFISKRDLAHTQLALEDAIFGNQSVEISIHLIHQDGSEFPVRAKAWSVADPETDERLIVGVSTPR